MEPPTPPSPVSLMRPQTWLPLDRVVAISSVLALVVIAMLLGVGSYIGPRVRNFNWADRTISARDTAAIIRFDRLMEESSSTSALHISPPLAGRVRWLGQRMAYTLTEPVPYGQTYTVQLDGARDRQGRELSEPYTAQFRSPDRQFLVIGTEAAEKDRLVYVNASTDSRAIVTPDNLTVTDFQPGGDGDAVYYLATPGTFDLQQLYRLSLSSGDSQLLLDNTPLQNFRLKVSPDGELVIVERLDPSQVAGGTELWAKMPGSTTFQPVTVAGETGGDFAIAPDNASLILAQEQGLAVVKLDDRASIPDFLPEFGQIVAIESTGRAIATIRFNADFTSTLTIVTNTGNSYDLFTTVGSIGSGDFAPMQPIFYAAVGRIANTAADDYLEVPELIAFNWEAGTQEVLFSGEQAARLTFSLSPDGRSLLYGTTSLDGTADAVLSNCATHRTAALGCVNELLVTDTPSEAEATRALTRISGIQPKWIP